MIYFGYLEGLKQESAFETLVAILGMQPFWYREFKRERASFQDETRAGVSAVLAAARDTTARPSTNHDGDIK